MSVVLLQAEFDAGLVDLSEFESDVHIVTGMFDKIIFIELYPNQFDAMYSYGLLVHRLVGQILGIQSK